MRSSTDRGAASAREETGRPCSRSARGFPCLPGRARAGVPLPLDVSKGLEALLGGVDFDIVHVHDPFAPSAASVALRHSRSLNVGSFHEPSERVLSTQVARPLVEIFFGRLDARTATLRPDVRSDAALLPRRLRAGRARGPVPRRPVAGRGAGGRCARSDRVLPGGGARRASPLHARAPPPARGPRLGGGDLAAGRRRREDLQPAARPRARGRPAAHGSRTSWWRRPTSSASHRAGRARLPA